MTLDEALAVALDLATKGVAVGPVGIQPKPDKPGLLDKRPLTDNGYLDFTTDPDRLRELFADGSTWLRGDEVIGIGMVPASIGAVVFDLDRHDPDHDGVAYGMDVLGLPPHTYMQDTATGGRHAVYRKREPDTTITNANPWYGHGIDVRADKGYVVAAGTRTPWGSWTVVDGKPGLDSLAMVPADKWDALVQAGDKAAKVIATDTAAEPLPDGLVPAYLQAMIEDGGPWAIGQDEASGDRSRRFHALVGECRRAGLTQGQTVTALTPWCEMTGKFLGRISREVARSWGRIEDADLTAWLGELGADGKPVPADPRRFISRDDGLLVADLGRAITAHVPMMRDRGDVLWTYRGGVWQPDTADVVRTAVSALLGNRTRNAHTNNVRHYLLGVSPVIDAAPVPEYLNVRNGLLDWRTGDLHPHDPAVISTVQLGACWQPDATCPVIEDWLAEVLPADLLEPSDDGPGFIWEVLGYLCFSGNPLHKAILLLGNGRNGKGTFLRLTTALLGRDNVSAVDLHSLVTNRFRAAELFGKVANIAGDLDSSWLESTATFKAITGGDTIGAERKYGQPFDFTPYAVPVYSANKVFGTPDTTDGYMSRWVVVPFPNSFLGAEDRGLDDRLQSPEALDGLLVKAVQGLRALMARGNFTTPASVAEAFARFADESDPVRAFMRDVSRVDDDGWVERSKLWEVYRTWASDNGHRNPLSRNALYSRAESAGWVPRKRAGARGFVGRTLTVEIVATSATESHLEPIYEPSGQDGAGRAETPTPGPAYGGKGAESALSAPSAPDESESLYSDPAGPVKDGFYGTGVAADDPWKVMA
jgi:P4 family phage/plasmid primase-like protien